MRVMSFWRSYMCPDCSRRLGCWVKSKASHYPVYNDIWICVFYLQRRLCILWESLNFVLFPFSNIFATGTVGIKRLAYRFGLPFSASRYISQWSVSFASNLETSELRNCIKVMSFYPDRNTWRGCWVSFKISHWVFSFWAI